MKDQDLRSIPAATKTRIARAIESRLTTDPARYGAPLAGTLRGYWKLRSGDHRVVFKVVGEEVWILAIVHRKDVYDRTARRSS